MWEITGAEFTNQGVHTADGISIRFPRVTRIRDDKNWETATNLHELRTLFKRSSDSVDYSLILSTGVNKRPADDLDDDSPKKKARKPSRRRDDDDDEPKPSTSRGDVKIEKDEDGDEDSIDHPDVKVKMGVEESDESASRSNKRRVDGKKSPKKSPGKLITQFLSKNQAMKEEERGGNGSQSSNDEDEASRAAFYSFIGTDVSVKPVKARNNFMSIFMTMLLSLENYSISSTARQEVR